MSNNKIVLDGETLIDLTSDTVTANTLLNSYTAHNAAGDVITGSLIVQNYYIGANDPASSLGEDGDLYFKMEG